MISAYGLRADGRHNPLGVSTATPFLSWRLRGAASTVEAISVRIDATDEIVPEAGTRILNLVPGTTSVEWPFAALSSRQSVAWSVGVTSGGQTRWSAPGWIEAPLWSDDEWEAAAITHPAWTPTADPKLRTGFPELATDIEVRQGLRKARLYITATGVVEPTIDGIQALPAVLEPGYARQDGSTPAVVWDVTEGLAPGYHRLVLSLGGGAAYVPRIDGRYTKYSDDGSSLPSARARLELSYADGSTDVVATGESWHSRQGPTTVAHWYGGEDHDGTAAGAWYPGSARVAARPVFWRSAPPVVPGNLITPVATDRAADGRRLLDLGVNVVGRPVIRTSTTNPGTTVRVAPSELLDDQGRIDQSTTGMPIWDSVVIHADTTEWRPSFVYHGGRYLEVTGLDSAEPADAVQFETMRANNKAVQAFTIEDSFLQRLHDIIDSAVRGNMFNVFTDCPHREKLGWLEQLHFCFDNLARGYDVQAHLKDAVGHMVAAQTPAGLIPNIAPEQVVFDFFPSRGDYTAFRDDPNWGRTIIELPWKLYSHYGDLTSARIAEPAIERYLAYLQDRSTDGLLEYGLGDWVEIDESTPVALVATWGWARALDTAARLATALGDVPAAHARQQRADEVWTRWREGFFNEESGRWGTGSQACHALALDSRALQPGEETHVFSQLVASIESAGQSITVGEIALPSLISALSDRGHDALIYNLIRREDIAGYGHQIASGATSLTESWQANTATEGVASQNHFMLSAIDEWIVGRAGGLRRDRSDIGWRKVVIDPAPLSIPSASLRFDSPAGLFDIQWHRNGSTVELTYDAPPHVEITFGRDVNAARRTSDARNPIEQPA
ncbi:glycoside hydrolase family 78 protein [Arthrobacter sp. R3-55]